MKLEVSECTWFLKENIVLCVCKLQAPLSSLILLCVVPFFEPVLSLPWQLSFEALVRFYSVLLGAALLWEGGGGGGGRYILDYLDHETLWALHTVYCTLLFPGP